MMTANGLLAGTLENCPVRKIADKDTNKFVLLCDGGQAPFVSVVEIFDEGGRTPPNVHKEAYEYFYVIRGEGKAIIAGAEIALTPGAYLVVPPGLSHEVHNTGSGRLYVLTTMVPDERFSDLIKSGPEAALDDEDFEALKGIRTVRTTEPSSADSA